MGSPPRELAEQGTEEMTNFAQNAVGVVAAFVLSGLAFAVTLA
jgi:hypothetical protein